KALNKSIKNKKKSTKTKKKSKVIIDSEDSSENDHRKSLSTDKLKYQEQLLTLKERELALRECEAKVHSIKLANLKKEQVLKSTS
ncbi:10030_t:CDS:1, partial [Racocetra persica]